jgi:DNA (cytosine-5)-methyltransferase 1
MSKIGIFSFFSGAGFLDLGFDSTDKFQTLYANEYHEPFMDIYKFSRRNLGIIDPQFGFDTSDIITLTNAANLRLLKSNLKKAKTEFPMVGFIGGPPCPDFSIGGKNKGKHGENGKLSGTYISLICELKPDFFLFENVKGLWRTKKHRIFYDSLKAKLVEAGYLITEKLINAIEYGVPQDRDRIIMIGFHKKALQNVGFENNGTKFLWNFDWNTLSKYDKKKIFDLNWPKTDPFSENSILPSPSEYLPIELTVEYWFRKNDVINHPNSEKYFIPRAALPKFEQILEGDTKKKSFKRLHRWRYSPTAAYGNNEVHLHPYKARRISVAEALAIQSLPRDFEIQDSISLTDSFKTIGNGVPFLAAKALAFKLFNFININSPSNLILKINGDHSISSKHSVLYKSTAEGEQLSVLEPNK